MTGMRPIRSLPSDRRRARPMWRAFESRDRREIDHQLREERDPCCPCCGELLEAHPGTRLARYLPLDATGYDLECRGCRRFRCVVRHTARSLRLLRMRRLVAAVRAAGGRGSLHGEPMLA
ncbi:MAG TPA: hypothetical protein VHG28_24755 [Longimicrobiaceae bacterium]|nr:hypothetical protein [Longimicrobiaceae bacterium]